MGLSIQFFEADFFRALTHPIRIRILEMLGTASAASRNCGMGLEQPIVSQQLAILRGKTIVTPPMLGTALRYALSDPLLTKLSVTREFFNDHVIDTRTMLREFQARSAPSNLLFWPFVEQSSSDADVCPGRKAVTSSG